MQIQISNCQALDANGISLTEKVLAIERLMLTPGTIDFQVAPCDFLLNGPPPLIAGDQVCYSHVNLLKLPVRDRSPKAVSEVGMIPSPFVLLVLKPQTGS